MLEALCDPLFSPLLDRSAPAPAPGPGSSARQGVAPPDVGGRSSPRAFYRGSQGGCHTVVLSHYHRAAEDGGLEMLPHV